MATDISPAPAQSHNGFQYASVLSLGSGTGIILTDAEGRLFGLTDRAEQILELKPVPRLEPSQEPLPLSLVQLARQAAVTSKPQRGDRIELPVGRGAPRLVRVTAIPLKQNTQAPTVILLLEEAGASPEFEPGILRLNRLASLGTLGASTAHEIKNALVTCKTFIDLLLERNQDMELAQLVRQEMGRVDALVSQLLKFAAPHSETLGLVHIHQVLEHSVRLLQPQFQEKSITADCRLDAGSDLVQGHAHELQQVFVNLLLNAVEAMAVKGRLTVTTGLRSAQVAADQVEPNASQLWISIQDTGPGISPDVMAHLFEPFVTTKPEGSGLGLSITRQIVQRHQGVIRAQSQPGQGTTFTIIFPTPRP